MLSKTDSIFYCELAEYLAVYGEDALFLSIPGYHKTLALFGEGAIIGNEEEMRV